MIGKILKKNNLETAKKIFASFMIPIFVLQMSALNLVLASPAIAATTDTQVAVETSASAAESPAAKDDFEKASEAKVEVEVAVDKDSPKAASETPEDVVAPAEEDASTVTVETTKTEEEVLLVAAPVEEEKGTDEDVTKETVVSENEARKNVTTETEDAAKKDASVEEATWKVDGEVAVIGPVELNTTYTAPQNDQVTVTFTKLPDEPGILSIEEITLTDEQVTMLGALSNKAYDITSDMKDGTFKYDLTLPKPKNQENVQIKFAEDVAGLEKAETVPSDDVKTKTDSVGATLDHFTFFAVTGNSYDGTGVATGIGLYEATLNGFNGDEGDASNTSFWWGTTSVGPFTAAANASSQFNALSGWKHDSGLGSKLAQASFNEDITGLTPDTTYYFVAWSKVGGIWHPGEVKNFTTEAIPVPTLISPANDDFVKGSPSLVNSWSSVSEAVKYIYESYDDAGATISRWNDEYNTNSKSANNVPDSTFWWRVKAVDKFDNESDWSDLWKVTVDNTAPVINTHSGITEEATSSSGAVVTYTNPTFTDDDPSTSVTCIPASGATFSIGTTQVSCDASDGAGNNAVQTYFDVVVQDTTAPVVHITALMAAFVSGTVSVEGTVTDVNPDHYYAVVLDSSNNVVAGPGTVNDKNNFSGKLFDWDTTNVGDGTYTIKLAARDAFGNRDDSVSLDTKTVTVDNTAPNKLTITKPLSEQYFNSQPIRDEWTMGVDSGSDVDYYRVEYVYDDGHTFSGAPYRTTNNNWRNHTPNLTEQGGVTIRVQAVDNAGNEGEWSDPVHYFYDTIAPAAPTLVSPANDAVLNGSPSLLSSWSSVSDAVKYIYESYNDAGATSLRWHDEYPTNSKSANNVADSTFWWRVKAVDAAGNESDWSDLWKVTIDNIVPSTPVINGFLNPDLSCGAITNSKNITVDWSDSNDANLAGYNYSINYPLSPGPGRGTWNPFFNTLTSQYGGSLNEGVHHIKVQAKDAAGNVSDWSNVCDITYDSIAPDVDITAPVAGFVAGTIDIKGTVTDANPDHYYLVIKNDSNHIVAGPGVVNDTNSFTDQSLFSWDTTKVSDGTYVIDLEARDKADNKDAGSVKKVTVTVDNKKPESFITLPANEGNNEIVYSNDWDGTISGTATDALSGVAGVQVSIINDAGNYWNGATSSFDSTTEVMNDAIILTGAGTTSATWSYDIGSQGEDTYTIKSHAVDNAGNQENTYTLTIVYDKIIPTVDLSIDPSSPNGDNNWYDSKPDITLTATDDNKLVDKIEYQIDSQDAGTWTTYSTPVEIDNGKYVFYYRSLDLAGNYSGIGAKNVKVDTENPPTVKSLDARYDETNNAIKLSWDAGDSDIYKVYVYKGTSKNFHMNSGSRLTKNNHSDESTTDDNVSRGEKYYYKFVSVDEAGNESDTKIISLTVPETGNAVTVTDEGTQSTPAGTVEGVSTSSTENTEEQGQTQNQEGQEQGATEGTDQENGNGQVEGASTVSDNGSGNDSNSGSSHTWWWILVVIAALLSGAWWWKGRNTESSPKID